MDHQQHPATLIPGKTKENSNAEPSRLSSHHAEIVYGEAQGAYRPSVAGFSDATFSSSFATTLQEPCDAPSTKSSDDTLCFSLEEKTQVSLEQPCSHFGESFEIDNTADPSSRYQQDQQALNSTKPHKSSGRFMPGFSFDDIPKPARYYAAVLSEEDTHALTRGEKNHNLKEWSSKDLIAHHESRKNLVPRMMPRVEKTKVLAGIEHDKQQSQRAVAKVTDKVRQLFGLPRIKITADEGKEEGPSFKQLPQASKSACDLRSIDVSVPQPSPSPTSPPTPKFSVDDAPIEHRYSHIRASSSGDYFSQRPSRRTGAYHNRPPTSPLASPGPSSENSVRIRSPLAQEVQFRHNPELTFDTFLVPHKSGKGETHHDAVNAKKPKAPKRSPVASPQVTPKTKKLGRNPSLPLLRSST
ncbi:hypothetical protein DDE82_004540 [Stemphylium lycopersici]|uniref:Uncharacterized protein n=1 Tax=Stemphylium lycopersici TaxID=183478 RepID=A0A364MXQ5_STELY|nr:hypothetical protein DDE82_004540 [Stemphylium lycopersici]RAR06747.1 hypothetical protein DDE83_006806 [Stemphylium lycopersici]